MNGFAFFSSLPQACFLRGFFPNPLCGRYFFPLSPERFLFSAYHVGCFFPSMTRGAFSIPCGESLFFFDKGEGLKYAKSLPPPYKSPTPTRSTFYRGQLPTEIFQILFSCALLALGFSPASWCKKRELRKQKCFHPFFARSGKARLSSSLPKKRRHFLGSAARRRCTERGGVKAFFARKASWAYREKKKNPLKLFEERKPTQRGWRKRCLSHRESHLP
ncbi:Putative hypothetical protein [Helicobacter mustelae 12198]|uniref:Uncharacterized protein n=1 Tax=Helicobacter mustelae (strain ATCC 43772 / CCUG 25715 / CIP 103759 / LMG 18044 / NCTC 12198 / R85-136P) TaxID=679897 RepID=D3UHL8_HELM1|nr:Putative hypothetical protein [Helicobacter mustelae 12198]SQH71502.1 Uncharacterised protein [Helicobacter mustelae]